VPPIVLILQLIEMTLSSLGNISGVFQTLNIPTDPYYLLEQYIPHIDWAAFRDAATKYQTTNKIKAEIQTAKDNADMNAGGEAPPPQQPAPHPRQPAAQPHQ
jgi:hypothetical protein